MTKQSQVTLSKVRIERALLVKKQRTTKQTIQILSFIHRVRHVTARHVQLNRGNSPTASTHHNLNVRLKKGLIARPYSAKDRAVNRPASYYLTAEGLAVLKVNSSDQRYRNMKSLHSDANASLPHRSRYHALADVYAHFKRHYNNQFEFFSAFDLAGLNYIPNDVPDGYIRLQLPKMDVQHYFVEIHGWNRSSYVQRRRIGGYIEHAENEIWQRYTKDKHSPDLFIVAASSLTQNRLNAQLRSYLSDSLVNNYFIYTTSASLLDNEVANIWQKVT